MWKSTLYKLVAQIRLHSGGMSNLSLSESIFISYSSNAKKVVRGIRNTDSSFLSVSGLSGDFHWLYCFLPQADAPGRGYSCCREYLNIHLPWLSWLWERYTQAVRRRVLIGWIRRCQKIKKWRSRKGSCHFGLNRVHLRRRDARITANTEYKITNSLNKAVLKINCRRCVWPSEWLQIQLGKAFTKSA